MAKVHVDISPDHSTRLDLIRSRVPFPVSRNSVSAWLLERAIDAEATSPTVTAMSEDDKRRVARALAEPSPTAADIKRRVDALRDPERPTLVIGDEIIIPGSAASETPPQRLERLRAAAGLSQHALCVELGISRGALQRATRKGEVPPEVEAWMQQREGGGR